MSEKKEVERPWIHVKAEALTERFFKWMFFWARDEKELGYNIRFAHRTIVYLITLFYVYIHVVDPSYTLLCLFVFIMVLINVHHILTGGCVVSKIEQKYLQDHQSFVDPILELLGMPQTPESSIGVVVIMSSVILYCSMMELLARTVINVRSFLSL